MENHGSRWFQNMSNLRKNISRDQPLMIVLIIISMACSATQELAPTFIPPTATPLPSDTPLPPPTTTPIPDPTDLTAIMAPPTPTHGPLGAPIPGAGCIPDNEQKAMNVLSVLSGDTILVAIEDRNVELLYIGITAPSPDSESGEQATSRNKEWVEGKTITVIHDLEPRNHYGQLEGYIITGEQFINYELVRQGFARAVVSKTNPACNAILLQAEEEARREKVGIWDEAAAQTTTPQFQDTPGP